MSEGFKIETLTQPKKLWFTPRTYNHQEFWAINNVAARLDRATIEDVNWWREKKRIRALMEQANVGAKHIADFDRGMRSERT